MPNCLRPTGKTLLLYEDPDYRFAINAVMHFAGAQRKNGALSLCL
jgi:hypothetical protein